MDVKGMPKRNEKLKRIADELNSLNLKVLKFACRDHVPEWTMEGVTDGMALFEELDKLVPDGNSFIGELLCWSRRFNLASTFLPTDLRFSTPYAFRSYLLNEGSHLSHFRMLLLELTQMVTEEDYHQIKYLARRVMALGSASAVNDIYDLLIELERLNAINKDNIFFIMEVNGSFKNRFSTCILNFLNRTYKSKSKEISDYHQRYFGGDTFLRRNDLKRHTVNYSSAPGPKKKLATPHMMTKNVGEAKAAVQSARPDARPKQNKDGHSDRANQLNANLPCYSMDRYPRGWCVIIANQHFESNSNTSSAGSGPVLTNRPGTRHDENNLIAVFEKLGFFYTLYRDCTRSKILTLLKKFSTTNHSRFDCFVMCLLSHGNEDGVYGTDGLPVTMQEITQPFEAKRCPSLAGKPKMFFISACRGNARQPGGYATGGDEQNTHVDRLLTEHIEQDARGAHGENTEHTDDQSQSEDENELSEDVPNLIIQFPESIELAQVLDQPLWCPGEVPQLTSAFDDDTAALQHADDDVQARPEEMHIYVGPGHVSDLADHQRLDQKHPIRSPLNHIDNSIDEVPFIVAAAAPAAAATGGVPRPMPVTHKNTYTPAEPDFVIGYASVGGYVTYRSRIQGTWYITKLTQLLGKYCNQYDLLSILTMVNKAVASAEALVENDQFKQMPETVVTLCKKLYLRAILPKDKRL